MYLLATSLARNETFVAELARKGCRKINYSVMPARSPGGDVLIEPRKVPIDIRRTARAILLGEER